MKFHCEVRTDRGWQSFDLEVAFGDTAIVHDDGGEVIRLRLEHPTPADAPAWLLDLLSPAEATL